MFGHLLDLQRRFGREQFPLIDQTFYPNHREMVSAHFSIQPSMLSSLIIYFINSNEKENLTYGSSLSLWLVAVALHSREHCIFSNTVD